MEDAATAEISRAQIWQWQYHGCQTEDDGVVITKRRISKLVHEEVKRRTGGEDRGKWFLAGKLVSCYKLAVRVFSLRNLHVGADYVHLLLLIRLRICLRKTNLMNS